MDKIKVIIKDQPHLAPYWRGREGRIITVHKDYFEIEVREQVLYLTEDDFERKGVR